MEGVNCFCANSMMNAFAGLDFVYMLFIQCTGTRCIRAHFPSLDSVGQNLECRHRYVPRYVEDVQTTCGKGTFPRTSEQILVHIDGQCTPGR